jgi:hypothetical protein
VPTPKKYRSDEERREAARQSHRKYYNTHREARREGQRKYYKTHREAIAERDRKRRATMKAGQKQPSAGT